MDQPDNPRKPQKPEIVHGDKNLRQNLLIFIALYILAGVLLNSILDSIVGGDVGLDANSVQQHAERRDAVGHLVFGIWRTVPVLYFLYLSFRIVASAKIPPGGMKRFPFTVPRIKGATAKMFGLLLMAASFMLVYREFVLLVRNAVG